MGCVSSALLEAPGGEDDRCRIISHHHIVSLTSSTYGILTYNSPSSSSPTSAAAAAPPPPPPPPLPPPAKPDEVINSWELMAGLHDPSTPAKPPLPPTPSSSSSCKPDRRRRIRFPLRPIDGNAPTPTGKKPPSSASVVLYTTSLRGVRATFEACNAVRAALQAHGVAFRDRDVSMDRGFREDLRDQLRAAGGGYDAAPSRLPRLFVRGRHVGGAEEVLRMDGQGLLATLLEGLPRARGGTCCCDGCGGMRFLPCFDCSGSRKVAVAVPTVPQLTTKGSNYCRRRAATVVVRCRECNENGLVLCPICS